MSAKKEYEQARSKQNITIGKKIGYSIYLHKSALCSALSDFLEVWLADKTLTFNVIRINRKESRFSLLHYPAFFEHAFPKLERSYTINLDPYQIIERFYDPNKNPPILHRKELLLKRTHPQFKIFESLSQKALQLGLLDHKTVIGRQQQWEKILSSKKVKVEGNYILILPTEE